MTTASTQSKMHRLIMCFRCIRTPPFLSFQRLFYIPRVMGM